MTSLVKRLITNAKRGRRERADGPLTTNEIESTVCRWIKRVQQMLREHLPAGIMS